MADTLGNRAQHDAYPEIAERFSIFSLFYCPPLLSHMRVARVWSSILVQAAKTLGAKPVFLAGCLWEGAPGSWSTRGIHSVKLPLCVLEAPPWDTLGVELKCVESRQATGTQTLFSSTEELRKGDTKIQRVWRNPWYFPHHFSLRLPQLNGIMKWQG